MDEGRLGATRRRSKHIRKVTHVLNEIIKNKQVFNQHCLAREQEDNKGKLLTQLVNIRREVVRKRVLLQCLNMRKQRDMVEAKISIEDWERQADDRSAWSAAVREGVKLAEELRTEALEAKRAGRKAPYAECTKFVCSDCGRDCKANIGLLSHSKKCKKILATSSENSLLGVYGGRALESFSRDVDQRIAWYHPKLRRHRHVDRLKQNSLDQGEILNEIETKEKIDNFFNKIREEEVRKALAKQRERILPNKKTLRRLGGLLVGDDDAPREGDFPDPFGTVKKTYDQNPFEKLASLRPNYYKVDLLRGVVTSKEKSSLSRFDSVVQKSSITKSPLPNIHQRRQPASFESTGNAKNRSGKRNSRVVKTKERTDVSDANSDTLQGDVKSVKDQELRKSTVHDHTSRPDLTRLNSLILPPIQVAKSMVRLKL